MLAKTCRRPTIKTFFFLLAVIVTALLAFYLWLGLSTYTKLTAREDPRQVIDAHMHVGLKSTEQAEKPEAQHVPPGFQGAGKIIEEGDQSGTVRPKYKIVVGIPVAKRSPPTVLWTARQLVRYANSSEHKLLSWISISAADDQEIKQGLADLGFTVHAYHSPYRELLVDDKKIKRTWNHPVQRVKWRTNERKLAKTHMYTKAHYMTRASSAHMTYDLS